MLVLMNHEHATAAIVSIGDELTRGEAVDTNSAWVAQRLVERGVRAIEHRTLPDDLAAIAGVLGELAAMVDLVISTGGLGPTDDDLTRRALAAALGEELVEDAAALARLEQRFAPSNRALLPANRVQAQRPVSARCLDNEHGTAPGLAATLHARGRRCDIFCLPGPPNEMAPMFEGSVGPALRPPAGFVISTRELHEFGLPESAIPGLLGGLMERGRNPGVGTAARISYVTCKIRFEGAAADAPAALDDAERRVRAALEPYIFAAGDGTLAGAVVALLRERGETLVTAESCTGGMIAAALTDIAGSSDVYAGGVVAYSNELKSALLGVPAGLIAEHGAVSEPVARRMAEGALARAADAGKPATRALAVTGIAGPGGGSAAKPVGTVWIAHACAGEPTDARLFRFPGDRAVVRDRTAHAALGMLRLGALGFGERRLLWENRS